MSARFVAAFLSLLVAFGATGQAVADSQSDATALVDRVHKATLEIAHEGAPVPASLRAAFDGPFIAKTVLGKYWNDASAGERKEFVDALLDAIVRGLVRRLGRHRDEDFAILSTRTIGGGDVLVRSKLSPPAQDTITVDWRIHRCPAGLCIADLIVGGASISVQRRDDVAARMSANGGSMTKLIADLRKRSG